MSYTVTGNYTNDVDTAKGSEVSTDLNAGANAFNAHEASTAEHGATGANVGTTNSQTLTSKTLTAPIINAATVTGTITANTGIAIDSTATTQTVIDVTADALTSGDEVNINSNSADVTARNLLTITNDNAAATGAVCLKLKQDSTGDILQVYDGATLTARIDDVGQLIAPMLVPGQVQNLSLTLSGTTLTIASGDGTALSATNPGWVCLTSDVTPGTNITTSITANQTLDLTAIDGFEFGITASVNWANDMPFFVKMARSDADAVAFFISRSSISGAMPVANSIGDAGTDPVTDSQIAHIAFTDITPGDYDGNPCYTIGAFRMQYTGATTRWAVQTMSTNDGFGQDKVDATCAGAYTFPPNQNGAIANSFFKGLAPTWAAIASAPVYYTIDRNGNVYYYGTTVGAGNCTNGGDGLTVQLALPYNRFQATDIVVCGPAQSVVATVSVLTCAVNAYVLIDNLGLITTGVVSIADNALTNVNDDLSWAVIYKAF